jgi:membrane-associated phospholipid phosphatase
MKLNLRYPSVLVVGRTKMVSLVCNRHIYFAALTLLAVDFIWLGITRAALDYSKLGPFVFWAVFFTLGLILSNWIVKTSEMPRPQIETVSQLFEVILFIHVSGLGFSLLNHLTMMTNFPTMDATLAALDQALWLDWQAYFELIHAHPNVIQVLEFCYGVLTPVTIIVLIGLILLRKVDQARFYIEVFFWTAIFCIIVGSVFPANAAVAYLVPDLSLYPNFKLPPGIYHIPYLNVLRDLAAPIVLDPQDLPGLVTFPSFHTASGIILCVACWRTIMFIPSTVYSSLMIASAPIFGGHYIVDLIAGALVALFFTSYFITRPRNRNLFCSQPAFDGKSIPEEKMI